MALFDFMRRKDAAPLDVSQLSYYMTGAGALGASGVSQDKAMQIQAVYACVKVISETIATMPCHLYRTKGEQNILHPDSPASRVVGVKPNDYMTPPEMWQWVSQCLLLDGNAYFLINRAGSGTIVELLPLLPGSVSPVINRHEVTYTVAIDSGNGSQSIKYKAKDILHIRGLSLDGFKGLSPVAYNGLLLSGANQANIHTNAILANDSTPRGILSTDGELDDSAYKNIKQSWEEMHQGATNSGKVAVTEQGLKFTQIQMSPADAQLLEQRKHSRSEIAGMFRVPPHMIGDLERATYSNIESQSIDFYKGAIAPWLTFIEARLNRSLLPVGTQFFKFDTSELLRGDTATLSQSYGKLLELGVMSPNEVRAKMGMNPRPGGDEYVSQSNNLTFGNEEPKDPQEPIPDDK